MFIAQELRKSNIAEYLLYMWQVENIIRAFDCSLSRIRKEYIERFEYDEEQKRLIDMHMKSPALFVTYYRALHKYREIRYGKK